jgi:hypothetical protein
MDEIQRDLHANGTTILSTTFPDLSSFIPAARPIRKRLARFNAGPRAIAAERGTLLLDAEQTRSPPINDCGARTACTSTPTGIAKSPPLWPPCSISGATTRHGQARTARINSPASPTPAGRVAMGPSVPAALDRPQADRALLWRWAARQAPRTPAVATHSTPRRGNPRHRRANATPRQLTKGASPGAPAGFQAALVLRQASRERLVRWALRGR